MDESDISNEFIKKLKKDMCEKMLTNHAAKLPLISKEKLKGIKPGDTIKRALGGLIELSVVVCYIRDGIIYTGNKNVSAEDGWKFNAETGLEIDEEIGWDGKTISGSYLTGNDTR